MKLLVFSLPPHFPLEVSSSNINPASFTGTVYVHRLTTAQLHVTTHMTTETQDVQVSPPPRCAVCLSIKQVQPFPVIQTVAQVTLCMMHNVRS